MLYTCTDLLRKFRAVTAYTQSDEITLVFDKKRKNEKDSKKELQYQGRAVKWCTLMSSYATIRFVFHLNSLTKERKDEQLEKSLFHVTFDSRLFCMEKKGAFLELYIFFFSSFSFWKMTLD